MAMPARFARRCIASPTGWPLQVFVVANGSRPIRPTGRPNVEMVTVEAGADVADDWIADRIVTGDVCITSDIPLASRCLAKAARALSPKGHHWTGRQYRQRARRACGGRASARDRNQYGWSGVAHPRGSVALPGGAGCRHPGGPPCAAAKTHRAPRRILMEAKRLTPRRSSSRSSARGPGRPAWRHRAPDPPARSTWPGRSRAAAMRQQHRC